MIDPKKWHEVELYDKCTDFKYKVFNCFYTNVDSLPNKLHELEFLVKNQVPKVIGICETKPKNLATDLSESLLQIKGYCAFFNNLKKMMEEV